MFMNRKSGYYEHLVKHEVQVISQRKWMVFSLVVILSVFWPSVFLALFRGLMGPGRGTLLPFNGIEGIYGLVLGSASSFKGSGGIGAAGSIGIGLLSLMAYVLGEKEGAMLFF